MARRNGAGPVGISEVADAEGLSPDYTAKLLRVLRQGELLTSTRGAAGGYALARPAADINVWQVLEILGGPLFSESLCDAHAGLKTDCVHTGGCSMRGMWTWLGAAVREALSAISLADLLGSERSMTERLSLVSIRQHERVTS